MFELQDYFASKECGKNFEADAIKYTFKTMQLLGYEVRLFYAPPSPEDPAIEVDLSTLRIRPSKEMKKEMKRAKKQAHIRNGGGGGGNAEQQEEAEGESEESDEEEKKQGSLQASRAKQGDGAAGDFSNIQQSNKPPSIPQPKLKENSVSDTKVKKGQMKTDKSSSSSGSSYNGGGDSGSSSEDDSSSSDNSEEVPQNLRSPPRKRGKYNLTDNNDDDLEDRK